MSYLDKIVAQRRLDVAEAKAKEPEAKLRELIAERPPPANFVASLKAGAPLAVLAEFKRASPSKGDIATDLIAAEQAIKYASAGANTISVLTEPSWFKGSLADMQSVKVALAASGHWPRTTVLRKDFIIDAYQLLEARAHGADTALLIVAILDPPTLAALVAEARALGMEPLVEVNTEAEMQAALDVGARVIGVNNRNLHTFEVDMTTTPRLAAMIPAGALVQLVSLSGVSKAADVGPALEAGAVGVLVGEALMRAADPSGLVRALRGAGAEAARAPPVRCKTCGIKDTEAALAAADAGADLLGLIFAPSKRQVDASAAAAIVTAVKRRAADQGKADTSLAKPEAPPGGAAADPAAWFGKCRAALDAALPGNTRPLIVGVFQDQPVDFINETAAAVGLDIVQLHGNEPADTPSKLHLPAARVVHIEEGMTADDVRRQIALHAGYAAALLLDSKVAGARGGTGKAFDWAVAAELAREYPFLVAGGLRPDNVAQAVSAIEPCWGVDASSGLETGGAKDPAKIQAFVAEAKAAARPAGAAAVPAPLPTAA